MSSDAQISEDKRSKEDMVTGLIHSLLSLSRRMQINRSNTSSSSVFNLTVSLNHSSLSVFAYSRHRTSFPKPSWSMSARLESAYNPLKESFRSPNFISHTRRQTANQLPPRLCMRLLWSGMLKTCWITHWLPRPVQLSNMPGIILFISRAPHPYPSLLIMLPLTFT